MADPATNTVVQQVGPFASVIRPFTINGAQTRVYVNVNDLLGFEIGDLKTGKVLQHVEVKGYEKGEVKRHGCPSHGIALTPDEKELWLADGHNSVVHVFDMTAATPKQIATIKVRDQPGWITFRMDGKHVWPSTGEIVDAKTKKIVATLTDEQGRMVQSEKLVEVVFDGNARRSHRRPVRNGTETLKVSRREALQAAGATLVAPGLALARQGPIPADRRAEAQQLLDAAVPNLKVWQSYATKLSEPIVRNLAGRPAARADAG